MSHENYLRIAIQNGLNHMLQDDGGPFGALIVKDDKIIFSSWNTVTSTYDPTAHAEINAIRGACSILSTYDLTGCILYSSCEPCPMCLSAAYWAHVDAIYYAATRYDAKDAGFDDSFIYEELAKENKSIHLERIELKESFEPFKAWIEKESKKLY